MFRLKPNQDMRQSIRTQTVSFCDSAPHSYFEGKGACRKCEYSDTAGNFWWSLREGVRATRKPKRITYTGKRWYSIRHLSFRHSLCWPSDLFHECLGIRGDENSFDNKFLNLYQLTANRLQLKSAEVIRNPLAAISLAVMMACA